MVIINFVNLGTLPYLPVHQDEFASEFGKLSLNGPSAHPMDTIKGWFSWKTGSVWMYLISWQFFVVLPTVNKPIDTSVVYFIQYHKVGNQNKHFIVTHRLVINQQCHSLKGHMNIFKTLKDMNCYLQNHTWSMKEWDIVSAGFISGTSPKHQAKDTIYHKLESIKIKTRIPQEVPHEIPTAHNNDQR